MLCFKHHETAPSKYFPAESRSFAPTTQLHNYTTTQLLFPSESPPDSTLVHHLHRAVVTQAVVGSHRLQK